MDELFIISVLFNIKRRVTIIIYQELINTLKNTFCLSKQSNIIFSFSYIIFSLTHYVLSNVVFTPSHPLTHHPFVHFRC